jgi:hypothetical protein
MAIGQANVKKAVESELVIQEFHISITPVGHDAYLLRTEAVEAGVPLAETQVTWPVDDWLAQTEALFRDPLQALLATPGVEGWPSPETVDNNAAMQLGQSLYQHLFQGRIRDSWLAAQGVAQNRQQPLRLRLGFKDSRLQRLPWELLYGDDRGLATGTDVTLCRYYQTQGLSTVDLATMPPLAPGTAPLNVLVVISAPNDQERLALSQEIQQVMADLRSLAFSNGGSLPAYPSSRHQLLTINLTILEQPGRSELVQALEQGNFQVLHYAGHSDVGETGGDLYLVNRQTGLTESLRGNDLAGLLVNNGIWLAVFNSCRGAYIPQDDAQSVWREQNLVQALVNRGVPAVIAMAERIPDDVAILFTQLLYRNLRQGYPVDLCLSRVRQGLMSAHHSDQPLWMLPLLYLRPGFDGYLYASTESAAVVDPLNALTPGLEPALVPPDYSTDPDISGLAREVFAGHAAIATSQPVPTPSTATTDWLTELDQHEPAAAVAETTAVANLVQQLSALPPQPAELSQPADPSENLLPQWDAATSVASALPHIPPAEPAKTVAVGESPKVSTTTTLPTPIAAVPAAAAASSAPPATGTRPPKWFWWGGAGLVGLGAAIGLLIALLPRPQAPTPLSPQTPESILGPSYESTDPTPGFSSGSDSVVVISAIQALTTDNPATARQFIEQLLDQRDLNAAQSVIAAAPQPLLIDPDIAFVRGRLNWQQAAVGQSGASPNDALRAWSQALDGRKDFLEAWVAIGFAHYALLDYDQAVRAWEEALRLDEERLRDRDPDGPRQVSSSYTPNAIAGLALARQKQSEQAIDPAERQQLEEEARRNLLLVTGLDPTILDPVLLIQRWLWTPRLIDDWQTAVERLSVSSPPVEPTNN